MGGVAISNSGLNMETCKREAKNKFFPRQCRNLDQQRGVIQCHGLFRKLGFQSSSFANAFYMLQKALGTFLLSVGIWGLYLGFTRNR